jgi:hypothetical protein
MDHTVMAGFQYQTQQALILHNAYAMAGAACSRVYVGDELWKCFYGEVHLRYSRI